MSNEKRDFDNFIQVMDYLQDCPMKEVIFVYEFAMYKYRYNDFEEIFEKSEKFIKKDGSRNFFNWMEIDLELIREHFLNNRIVEIKEIRRFN